MSKYAHFDAHTGAVLNWMDTDAYSYDAMPPSADLLAVTEAQWNNRSGAWYVLNGALTQTPPAPPPVTLAEAQAAQTASIYAGYAAAIAQNVAYTSKGGVAQTYQADDTSMKYVTRMLDAYGSTSTTPSGFYWVAADNTQVAFTYADLQGLASAMGDQGWAAFQRLQDYKAQIRAATTVSAVQAVVWS